jgi:replicative DNA helicase
MSNPQSVAALEHVLPQSHEAEVAVLGSMLAEKESMLKAMDLLREDDFYEGAHQQIFTAIRELHDKNITPDIVTVGDLLQRNDVLADVGGHAYLMHLVNTVPVALHVEHYARIVKEKSILRQMISLARSVQSDCYMQKDEARHLLDKAQQEFFALAESKSERGMVTSSRLMQETIQTLEKLFESNKLITGIPTGFKELDKMTKGFQPANLIIVAGRPSMGKTSFVMDIAAHVAIKEKRPVLFFSLEMSGQEMGLRLVSSLAKINLRSTAEGFLPRKSWPNITNVASEIAAAPLLFDFSTSPSIMDIRASSRRYAHELKQKGNPLGLIIIDYLQLLTGSGPAESRQQEVSEISRSLKALARELNIPVVALSQLSRRPEERGREGRPQLSDLRESGAIEQDADLVAAIFREEVYKRDDPDLKGKAKLFILKQRNGPVGDIDLYFLGDFAKFVDPARDEDPF